MSWRRLLLSVLALVLHSSFASAELRLPALVSDGMVLQQKAPVRIWGWAPEGEKVTVTFRGQSASAQARGGLWVVTLKPLDAGGPFELTITAGAPRTPSSAGTTPPTSTGPSEIVLKDVWVGEVWVCSGQSNMEFQLARSFEAKADIEAPADPALRMFTVGRQVAEAPRNDVTGK